MRGSRSPQWLAELGYAAPAESEVKEVGRAFAKVMNLLAPPTSLMAPGMLVRVLRAPPLNHFPSSPISVILSQHCAEGES